MYCINLQHQLQNQPVNHFYMDSLVCVVVCCWLLCISHSDLSTLNSHSLSPVEKQMCHNRTHKGANITTLCVCCVAYNGSFLCIFMLFMFC